MINIVNSFLIYKFDIFDEAIPLEQRTYKAICDMTIFVKICRNFSLICKYKWTNALIILYDVWYKRDAILQDKDKWERMFFNFYSCKRFLFIVCKYKNFQKFYVFYTKKFSNNFLVYRVDMTNNSLTLSFVNYMNMSFNYFHSKKKTATNLIWNIFERR